MSWMEVRARPFSSYSSRAATTISAYRLAVSLLRSTSRVATPRVLFLFDCMRDLLSLSAPKRPTREKKGAKGNACYLCNPMERTL